MEYAHFALALALMPVLFGIINLRRMARLGGQPLAPTRVSILIPARNEAANIGACLDAALASTGCEVEVVVMDDGSSDATAEIVRAHAARDGRVRLVQAPSLPPGWTGKVHACARLAEAATGTHFLFIDADVRLAPHAAAAMAAHAEVQSIAMVSGVPRQIIKGLGEGLTVPFINFLLICYLPFGGRSNQRKPSLAAACGQLILVERRAYEAIGGHGAIKGVLHDGIALARRFREKGHDTEIVDGTPLATCRMYEGFAHAWGGFIKNAREGMATPIGLPIWTVLLAGGHLWPWALLPAGEAMLTIFLMFALRAAVTWRTGEPWWTVPLHPLTVLVALAIQWTALVRSMLGYPAGWKGRAYAPAKA
ncbi:glycosyltransferase family 2 protein [Sediminicoccus sp. KRV36]|uniref:glycosyltransferase n=1 Tax=Sediminicoccus sp. KRV36 TaxID=3133721 RepID=UPI00200D4858|nr:glycosyltransferase family 2 protein [Sediminicoccus rosea]UPY38009.1 glycosyltransferase family 2 protein [Sediminicoccus rosea]